MNKHDLLTHIDVNATWSVSQGFLIKGLTIGSDLPFHFETKRDCRSQ